MLNIQPVSCGCEDRPCCGCGTEFVGDQHEGPNEHERDLLPGEDMDGDHASALASAGFGTDEDYGGGTHLEDQRLDGMGEE